MIALVLLLQTSPYTATVDTPVVEGASVEFSLSTNLPDKAVVTLLAHRVEFEYNDEHDRLTLVALPTRLKTTAAVKGGKASGLKLIVTGVYTFEVRFDPSDQQYGPLIRKKMGLDKYALLLFHMHMIVVGASSMAVDQILADAAECREITDECRGVFAELDAIADGEEAKMAASAKPTLDKLAKLFERSQKGIDKTLLNGTRGYVQTVLCSTAMAGQWIERMAKFKRDPTLLEPNTTGN